MKRLLHVLLISLAAFCTQCKNRDELNVMDDEGLSLYWQHTADVERGRHLRLSFFKSSSDKEEYKFEYRIQGRVIDVRLVEKISKGKCPVFPGPWGEECQSWGDIYIPESELPQGTYQFRLQTGKTTVTSAFVVGHNQYELKIPASPHFTTNIPVIYAIPKGIVFGSAYYYGKENELFVEALVEDLTKAGLKPTTLPAHPYTYLPEDAQTHLQKRFWEPDSYLINFLFSYEGDFGKVAEICKKHFEQSQKRVGIGLWNSDFMEQITGEQYGTFSTYMR
ncbi:MAG: hypothetical protein BGO21_18760 [Dyadobacter sp. 50-39]|uniref:hypothetical protein n=1 Tax=Dyadobacter sp. 50-39 TaxID=1895756 RepID=UPI0009686B35|nr:hypothetical protein [Dyadobacter sp. 50-39]OJV14741.1 MAG: hypothetical protein BGO21_18760 [Dyadobacter sp. 50-39]